MCGPEGFMDASRVLLTEMGFNLANLHAESFAAARSHSDESVPVNDAEPTADQVTIELAKTGKRITGSRRQSLLEIAESHNVELDYGCRVGNCGDCRLKILSGEVNPGAGHLDPEDKKAGYVLSCVARPKGDCVIDA
jgi:ferredoxin